MLLPAAGLFSCNNNEVKEDTVAVATKTGKPNILFILADDMGYSDISPFGGNITTPVLAGLAKESILFSNYHAQPYTRGRQKKIYHHPYSC